MFCTQCGKELQEGSKFCGYCGAGVTFTEQRSYSIGVSNAPSAPSASESSNKVQPVAPSEQPAPKRSGRRGVIIAAVITVVVICAGIGVGIWWKSDQDAKAAMEAAEKAAEKAAEEAAWERAHVTLITHLTNVDAPGFSEESTAIPVQVKGMDLDGNAVDEMQFMRPGAMQVQTKQGSYDLVFPGGYFTVDGQAVKAPGMTLHVDVTVAEQMQGGSAGSSLPASSDEVVESPKTVDDPIAYKVIAPIDVTDADIEEIAKWAGQDPNVGDKVERLKSGVAVKHNEAVERARVEARMAQITQAADDFLHVWYDNNGPRGEDIKAERGRDAFRTFVNGNKSTQTGLPACRITSMNNLTAVDENTVVYDLDFNEGPMGPIDANTNWTPKHASGTLVFDENGLIDQWYEDGSSRNKLM